MGRTIDTDAYSARLRDRMLDREGRRVLIARLGGSGQEADMTLPANCGGFGRIRHFRRNTSPGWPENPLPIDPAGRALGLAPVDLRRAQVFQTAGCNWRCWYCFVPFDLLAGSSKSGSMMTAAELLDLYEAEESRPAILDLSGGQPDLTPEWVPWMIEELTRRGTRGVYVWSDDNLSNDYFWTRLTDAERRTVFDFPAYGRVCCFKGFCPESFAFNTNAAASLFDRQFDLMGRFVESPIDTYGYVTLTSPRDDDLRPRVRSFVDRLQEVHEALPTRVVPLEVATFGVVTARRLDEDHRVALEVQHEAVAIWQEELTARFGDSLSLSPESRGISP